MPSPYSHFFAKYQQDLVELANTSIGRDIFRISEIDKIVGISPNSYHFERAGHYTGIFRTYVGLIWNSTASIWDCIAAVTEA